MTDESTTCAYSREKLIQLLEAAERRNEILNERIESLLRLQRMLEHTIEMNRAMLESKHNLIDGLIRTI